jgi:MFS family permease
VPEQSRPVTESQAPPVADEAAARPRAPAALVGSLVLGGLAYGLTATMLVPTVPALEREFETTTVGAGWVIAVGYVSASVATGIIGRVGDALGKRRALTLTLLVFALGAVVCALAGSLWLMLVGRAIQGVGGAVYPLAYGILRDRLPLHQREAAIGLVAATLGVGGGFGPMLGGAIAEHASITWIFVVGGLLALSGAVATWALVPASTRERPPGEQPDVLGALVLSGTVVAPLIAASQANRWGWGDPLTLALFAAGAVLLVLFVVVERRVVAPLVNMRTIAHPVVLRTNLVGIAYSVCVFGALIAMTLVAQQREGDGFGLGATAAGLILVPHGIGVIAGGRLAVRLRGIGQRRTLLLGQAILLAGISVLVPLYDVRALLYVVAGVTGVGLGLVLAATTNLVVAAVPPGEVATATAITTIVRNIGGAIGAQVLIALLSLRLIPGTHAFAGAGFTIGMSFLAAAAAVGLLLAWVVPREPARAS